MAIFGAAVFGVCFLASFVILYKMCDFPWDNK
jgi:hypothetical protein